MSNREHFSKITSKLEMTPHPEGGFYREIYRSTDLADFSKKGERSSCTSIYFLVPRDQISKFHRLSSDEIWHFHQGDPITVVMITPNGDLIKKIVGPIGAEGAMPQVVIPKNTWFGAIHEGQSSHGYTLVGCTVSPGFEFADFELGSRRDLLKAYDHSSSEIQDWIVRLTAESEG